MAGSPVSGTVATVTDCNILSVALKAGVPPWSTVPDAVPPTRPPDTGRTVVGGASVTSGEFATVLVPWPMCDRDIDPINDALAESSLASKASIWLSVDRRLLIGDRAAYFAPKAASAAAPVPICDCELDCDNGN